MPRRKISSSIGRSEQHEEHIKHCTLGQLHKLY